MGENPFDITTKKKRKENSEEDENLEKRGMNQTEKSK